MTLFILYFIHPRDSLYRKCVIVKNIVCYVSGSVQREGNPENERHKGGLQLQNPRCIGEAQSYLR